MSKIICDVCGTSYPETATQCPICGCVRPVDVVTVNSDIDTNEQQTRGNYTYVKGGRFSKANVKKRNTANSTERAEEDIQQDEPQQNTSKGDKGLIAAICVLLLAIVAVTIYIALHFFDIRLPRYNQDMSNTTQSTTTAPTQNTGNTAESIVETTEMTSATQPCEDILLSNTSVVFDKVGAANLINFSVVPETTTDSVTFSSSDDTVATVDQNGKIVAVAPGKAIITIRCGEVERECGVECNFEIEVTEPSEEVVEPTETVPQDSSIKLNYAYSLPDKPDVGDVTITEKNATWVAYLDSKNEVPSTQVTFTTSDPNVVTIDKFGIVTAVGAGEAVITAEYKDQIAKCRVICKFQG